MREFLSTITIGSLLVLFCCATSKNINRADSPEDYYETDSSPINTPAATQEEIPDQAGSENKNLQTQEANKPSSNHKESSPPPQSKVSSERKEATKDNHLKTTSNPPIVKSAPAPVKTEEDPISPAMQEEMSDDNWAKDESKVRIKKKDKELIKDSAPDDEAWGRE